MIDSVIAGTGNSRYLRTSIPTGTTWEDALTLLRAGTFPIDLAGINAAGFTTVGTALTSDTLLKSAVLQELDLPQAATLSDAWEAVLELIRQTTMRSAVVMIPSGGWTGTGPYTQNVTISGYTFTNDTMIDLVCDVNTAMLLAEDGVSAVYMRNNNGTLTAYSTGAAPARNITVTCLIYEQSSS